MASLSNVTMRGGIFGRLMALASMGLLGCGAGCGAAPPSADAPEQGLPFVVPEAAPSAPAPRDEVIEEPSPPDPSAPPLPCPLRWEPHALGASVVHIPAELAGRMMTPLYGAACACTLPGQSIYLVARMIPERGEVTAQTKDYPELAARRSARIDACLAARLGTRIYEPFRVGSDVICEPAPGPRERGPGDPAPWIPPRRAGCPNPEEATTKISYPLHVDRRERAHP